MAARGRYAVALLGVMLLLFATPIIQDLAAYPYTPPYYPYGQPPFVITVHTTTISYSGLPSTNFTFDVAGLDSLSLITKLDFQVSSPLTNFVIKIFQLNTIPLSIPLPSGKLLTAFQFSVPPEVERNITTADFSTRVPQVEIQEFSIRPDSLQVQKFTVPNSWLPLATSTDNADANYIYLTSVTSGLSLFAVTGVQPRGISTFAFIALIVTILVASSIFTLSRRRSQGKKGTRPNLGNLYHHYTTYLVS